MSPSFNREFSHADVIYHWVCAKCAAMETRSIRHYPGAPVCLVSLPEQWERIGDQLYCPRHTVVHLVDGEVLVA